MNYGKESLRRAQKWKLENVHWCVSDGKTVFKVHEPSSTAALRENVLDIICGKPSGKWTDKAFYTRFAYWSSHKNEIIKKTTLDMDHEETSSSGYICIIAPTATTQGMVWKRKLKGSKSLNTRKSVWNCQS